ncbi:MAG: hypothetical protein E4H20_12620, partial [Spirochaetales bacterium]
FHEERLIQSLEMIGIAHSIVSGSIMAALGRLVEANRLPECNLKIIAVSRDGRDADWYAFALPAIVPPPDVTRGGVSCMVFEGQRQFPRAKSLSLLLSTVAFRRASAAGSWDALLLNTRGYITEGTRTNIFYVAADVPTGFRGPVYTPPAADVLEGITRRTLIQALGATGIGTEERSLAESEALSGRFALMVTSTSSNVLPVRTLILRDGDRLELTVPAFVQELCALYDAFLARYASGQGRPVDKE